MFHKRDDLVLDVEVKELFKSRVCVLLQFFTPVLYRIIT